MTHRLRLALAATLVSVLYAACMDSAVAPSPSLGGFSAAVTCQVTVSTATLVCGPATPVATTSSRA